MLRKGLYIIPFFIGFGILTPCKLFGLNKPVADSSAIIQLYEDTLKQLQYEKIKIHTSDAYKQEANQRFVALLKKALQVPGSFNYPFDSLKTLSRLTSPDKKFKILAWDIDNHNGSYGYYGFIQSFDTKKNAYIIYELKDKGAEITNPQNAVGTTDNWLGMLYYKIIPDEDDANTYILLAWQGYSDIITRKIIDVVSFNNEGVPSFGKVLFKKLPEGIKGFPKRIMFQYSADLTMSLNYDEQRKMILFDHLSPPDPSLNGQYQYYGPSFQVDALEYKDKQWDYVENVEARNPASSADKLYHSEGSDYNEKKKPIYTPH